MCLASSTNSHQGLTLPNFEGYMSRKNVQRCSTPLPDHCLTYTMNSTHLQTPPCPRIDQTQSKGTPRNHKTPKRIRNPGIKASRESIKVKVRSCRTETLRKQMSKKTRWIRVVIQVFRRSCMWFTQKVLSNSKLAMLSTIKVFFLQLNATRQLEHVISSFQPWPPNTVVHYARMSWAIDKNVGLFNSYIRLCINIFKNLGHGEVMVHDKQTFVQKNTMSQRWWYWKNSDKFLVLKKIPAHRPYALLSIDSLNLRKRIGITSVTDVATSCLFSGLCGKPLLRRMPARGTEQGLAPNLL